MRVHAHRLTLRRQLIELAHDAAPPVRRAHVDRVVGDVPDGEVVLVGHSASGRLIPLVADRLERPDTACVFVDAQLPTDVLPPAVDDWFVEHVHSLAADGVLPPWSDWWGAGAWEVLVADARRREQLEQALPRLTVAEAEVADALVDLVHQLSSCPANQSRATAANSR